MTLSTLGPTITSTGITIPSYAEILQSLQEQFLGIYGADTYIAADSQDGQMLAVVAKGFSDCNQAAVTLFNSFSPSYGLGTQLSSLVKINGLARDAASYSTCDVVLTGVFGTVIAAGIVRDTNRNLWDLPATVTIPEAGEITVTATSQSAGNITAVTHSLTTIYTPTFGWQTVTNEAAAVPGAAVETDAALRIRQAQSTSLPALTVMGAIVGTIESLSGVLAVAAYENDTAITDSNGLPEHSISLVVYGGDATEIATVVSEKKTPGCNTYGTTTENIRDPDTDILLPIHFFRPTIIAMKLAVYGVGLTGYTLTVGDLIKAALADYIGTLHIGGDVYNSKLVTAADATGFDTTYNITAVYQARADMVVTGGPYVAGIGTITVTGAGDFIPVGSRVAITLDNGSRLRSVVTGVATDDITFTPVIPALRSVVNGALVYAQDDDAIAFNELATCAVADIVLTVT